MRGWSGARMCGRSLKVRVAVRYYAAYRAEVDERIAAHREVVADAEATWRAEQDLLHGGDHAS
ncbi:MAG: hypothetical protein ACREQ5_22435 [Candidatus Dormibacteria bacterium]